MLWRISFFYRLVDYFSGKEYPPPIFKISPACIYDSLNNCEKLVHLLRSMKILKEFQLRILLPYRIYLAISNHSRLWPAVFRTRRHKIVQGVQSIVNSLFSWRIMLCYDYCLRNASKIMISLKMYTFKRSDIKGCT